MDENKKKIWKKAKEIANHIFIDGLSGMATGLFSTLIIGLIIQQIGTIIGGYAGNILFTLGKVAASLTGAGIGIGVAIKFKSSNYVTVSAGIAGMIGAFATGILKNEVFANNIITFAGPGEPLGAFIASLIGIGIGKLITGKTKIDVILVPLFTIISGGIVRTINRTTNC